MNPTDDRTQPLTMSAEPLQHAPAPRFGGERTSRPNTAWDAKDGSVAILLTTPGMIAFVDTNDYPLVEGIRWNARVQKGNRTVYAYGYSKAIRKCVFMHKLLAGANVPQVDHEDGNGLNNRRINLRCATHTQNQHNKGKLKTSNPASRYIGVSRTMSGKWNARIALNGKDLYLGSFSTEEDAALAYNLKATELRGEYARLNDVIC